MDFQYSTQTGRVMQMSDGNGTVRPLRSEAHGDADAAANQELALYRSDNAKTTDREKKRVRNARARRKLERLRDEKALRQWLTDVWDEKPS